MAAQAMEEWSESVKKITGGADIPVCHQNDK